MTPYFDDGQVVLYHGDSRVVLPELDLGHVGVVVADPPYGETSLEWDRWPFGWIDAVATAVSRSCSMWCFGSMRMFLDHGPDFAAWRLAQDIVWEKNNGSSMATDRFRRVHECATHWYRGAWGEVHWSDAGTARSWSETGTRIMRSVIRVSSCHGAAIHPTQKPLGILDPLLRYSLTPGGTVLDPFAGSCSTLVAAREAGYRAIGIEADEAMCEKAALRLSQGALAFGGTA